MTQSQTKSSHKFYVFQGKLETFLEVYQDSRNCAHGDERARNVHVKRFSRARNYVHVNQSKHFQLVLQRYLR